MKDKGSVILRDLSEDYPEAHKYVVSMLKGNRSSQTMISETMLVFEALCYKIFEQRENSQSDVKISGFRRMGESAVEITFIGSRFDPEPQDPSWITPEESILRAYADKIDYSYHSGSNRITITTNRNHLEAVGFLAASFLLGIAVYALLYYTASEEVQNLVACKIVFPMEKLFGNLVLMVGAPVTFLSMVKHLTDTYIIAGDNSSARRLHRLTISSSVMAAALAVICSLLLTKLFFSNEPMSGKYAHGGINLDPEVLLPSLIPSDIFTPFQDLMPFPLLILAALTTYSFCSIGKYFDRIKDAIDIAYVFFARMLSIAMFALPVFAFCSIMDELACDGWMMLLSLAKMSIAVLASLVVLLGMYIIRLCARGIRPLPFFKKMIPLLRENASIASAFDAVPYNIRYCARTYGFDRKRMEKSLPVLAQINLDGNCFLITMIAMLYIAINSTPLTTGEAIAVALLVLLLSLGAPNQPGSCLVGLMIVMTFLHADDLATISLFAEVFFGGILNLTNIVGDLVTVATEEVKECGSADKLNEYLTSQGN